MPAADIRIYQTLRDIDPQSWDICFPMSPENYAYLMATEEAGLKGFKLFYVTAWRNGLLVAAMPGFLTVYDLCTTLQGIGCSAVNIIRHIFPNFLKMKLACIGSPVTENALMGIHPGIALIERQTIFRQMLEQFERHALLYQQSLLGFKDMTDQDRKFWNCNLESDGYHGLNGLAIATLSISFKSVDEYLNKLSYATRKDMRRKLRSSADIRIEYRNNVDDVIDDIMKLYYQTLARSEMQFEELNPNFFQGVLRRMPQHSVCVLYYAGNTLIGANLLLRNNYTLLDKFFCMDDILGRQNNLYFVSWFTNLTYCLDHDLSVYQSGQAAYDVKVRLRSDLVPTTMYFRHSNAIIQSILNFASPLFAIDQPQRTAA